MRADEAQAIVARSLVDPRCLDHSGEPGWPAELRRDIHLFRGFITRIKHSQLRRIVPLTLRLLAVHRLDIAFFAEMAPNYLAGRAAGPLTSAQLFARFESELHAWLRQVSAAERDELTAILRHEARIWRIGHAARHAKPSPHPRLQAGVAVERFPLNVLALAEGIAKDRFVAPTAEAGNHFVLYYKLDNVVRIEAIDPLSAWLLSRLNGSTPIDKLTEELSTAVNADVRTAVHDLLADAAAKLLLDPAGA